MSAQSPMEAPVTTGVNEENIKRGQDVYTPSILNMYDTMVLNLSNLLIWQSKRARTQQFFQENITNNHLDVGVGTGYFLDHCEWQPNSRVGLMDLNENCLAEASHRINRLDPETYQHDVFKPFEIDNKFDSCSLNFLFHCLPGSVKEKVSIISNLSHGLNPGAHVFGTTVLHDGGYKTLAAKKLMAFYNQKGIFSNEGDSLAEYVKHLNQVGDLQQLEVVGTVCFFKLKLPS